MNSSILMDVRGALGLLVEDDAFDSEIIMHVNSALAILRQNGVGLPTYVTDISTLWSSFVDPEQVEGNLVFPMVKTYVFLKTKLLFDPPPPSNVTYVNESVSELLWRLREEYMEGDKYAQ